MVEEVARLLSQARGAYQREQYQVALAFFRQACQVDSHSPEALLGMGEVSSFLGFRDQAVAAFLSLADLYLRAAMFEVAAEVIERIIDLDPQNPVALRFQRFIAGQLQPRSQEQVSAVTAVERPTPVSRTTRAISEVQSSELEHWDRADSSATTDIKSVVVDRELDDLIGELDTKHPEGQPQTAVGKRKPNTIAFAETQLAKTPVPTTGPTRSRFSVTLTGVEEEETKHPPVSDSDHDVVTRTFEAAEITALDPEPAEKRSVIFDLGDGLPESDSVTDLDSDPPRAAPDIDIEIEIESNEREAALFDDISTQAAPDGMLQAIARANTEDDPFSDETVVAGDLPRLLARRTDPKFVIDEEATRSFDDEDDDEPGPLIEVVSSLDLDSAVEPASDFEIVADIESDRHLELPTLEDPPEPPRPAPRPEPPRLVPLPASEAPTEVEPEREPEPDPEPVTEVEPEPDPEPVTEVEPEREIDDDDGADAITRPDEDPFSRDTAVAGDMAQKILARRSDPFAADTDVQPMSPALLAAMGTGTGHRSVDSWEANTEAAVIAENFRDRPAISIDAATEELDLADFPSYEESADSGSMVSATIPIGEMDAAIALEELAPLSPLIGQLGPDGRAELLSSATVMQCFAGQVICRQGEVGTNLWLLLSGQAAVERTPAGASTPQRVASLSPGAFFGEGSVLADAPRSSTVRVIEDSLLVEIEREALQRLVKERPQLLTILTRFLRARLVSSMMMSSPLFLRLDMKERAALAPQLHVHKLNPGQQVVRRGQLLTGYCTVMAGELERTDLAEGTGKQLAGKINVGDSFGTSCLDARPSTVSIGAVTGCWLMRLPTESLRALCDSHPGMLEALSARDVLAE